MSFEKMKSLIPEAAEIADQTVEEEKKPLPETEPRKPVTVQQAMLGLTALFTVPSSVLILYFVIQFSRSAGQLAVTIQSPSAAIGNTLLFAIIIGALMWGLTTVYSYWVDFITARFNVSKLMVWLMVAPIALLGPFYYFGFTGVLSYKLKIRRGLIMSIPGFLAGYGLLMELDQILLGEFSPSWDHALMTPVIFAVAYVSGLVTLRELSKENYTKKTWIVAGVLLGIWIVLHGGLWIHTAILEQRIKGEETLLKNEHPMNVVGMRSVYYHDGQMVATKEGLLAKAAAAAKEQPAESNETNPSRVKDSKEQSVATMVEPKDAPQKQADVPAMPDAALLLALDEGEPDEKTQTELLGWLSENEKYFADMDLATTGGLFKAEIVGGEETDNQNEEVFKTLITWMGIYKARIHLALQNNVPEQALDCLKHMTWLRDVALDDPYIMACGTCNYLELMRLGCYPAILSSGLLTDAQLADLQQELAEDETRWNERAGQGEWAAMAWYMSHVQEGQKSIVTMGSAAGEIVLGLLGTVRLWMLRREGAWIMQHLNEQASESRPYNDFAELERVSAMAPSWPAYVSYSKMIPAARHQFISAIAKQRAVRTAIAVERFKLAHDGRQPMALSELVPQYLSVVPLDPFSGNELKYRREDFFDVKPDPKAPEKIVEQVLPGYQIYAISIDKTDNEGRAYVKVGEEEQGDLGISIRDVKALQEK
ncbi:MAG: hypothetical protein IJU61_07795 [Victivallales bacterium]|nr:hypothetical protein [Victivallales bacterium]